MSTSFTIVMPHKIEWSELPMILNQVYSEYDGRLFIPPEIKLFVPAQGKYVKFNPLNNDFSELTNYAEDIVYLNGDQSPSIYIFYKHDPDAFLRIDVPFYVFRPKKEDVAKANEWLEDILKFARLMVKHSGAPYFYGGINTLAALTSPDAVDVGMIYCKGKDYVKLLQAHVKNKFDVVLSDNHLEKIVEEVATIKREDGFTTLYFLKVESEDIGPRYNPFYEAVKRLIGK
ncbi:hypothetical protein HYV85_00630 [Candidatus Woesearchaeota archaeon]|nr:hypothetical protein [Candidatus Woesearchaeota archaeon]